MAAMTRVSYNRRINSLLTEYMVVHVRIQSSYIIKFDLF